MTLDEMATELEISRRTAERLRDSLSAIFPQFDYYDDEERVRRWRLPGSALVGISALRPEAVVAVETAARDCDGRGEANRAALLREAAATVRAMMHPDVLRRAEPDIAALMQAEGIAMRPGPRPLIAQSVLPTLRRAILGVQHVTVRYIAADAAAPWAGILCPYGILHGGRGWLVAHAENLPQMRLWRLDRIFSVDLLDSGFTRDEAFDLAAYAAQSFGVFQEHPINVILRFIPGAAAEAATWLFHPTQTTNREHDGSLTVRFRAGGMREMCWHLFTWGETVTVVAPEELRAKMAELANAAASHYSSSTAQTPGEHDG
jgi:predicted DNA-binding transcriptional regulator YafY